QDGRVRLRGGGDEGAHPRLSRDDPAPVGDGPRETHVPPRGSRLPADGCEGEFGEGGSGVTPVGFTAWPWGGLRAPACRQVGRRRAPPSESGQPGRRDRRRGYSS